MGTQYYYDRNTGGGPYYHDSYGDIYYDPYGLGPYYDLIESKPEIAIRTEGIIKLNVNGADTWKEEPPQNPFVYDTDEYWVWWKGATAVGDFTTEQFLDAVLKDRKAAEKVEIENTL